MDSLRISIASLIIFFLFHAICFAQETIEPYSARAYYQETKNITFIRIHEKQAKGDSLSNAELEWLNVYSRYLENYYNRLSAEEKGKFQEFKLQWDEEYIINTKAEESDLLETKSKGMKPGKKYSLYNGLYGFGYGLAGIFIFDLQDEPASLALPFLTSGMSMLWPLANKTRYENLNYSTVMLARHGKFVGAIHGAALGLLIFGDHPSHAAQILVPSVIGSIGLGELGFQLGKHKDWTEGRIATLEYYGILGPFIGVAGLIAAKVEHARPYGIGIPVSGLIGYYVGNRIYNKYQFSRGDMLAASSFGILSTGAGFGLVKLDKEADMLVPLGMSVLGTVVNHLLLKNKQLTIKQGWKINYVAGAGAVLGIGTAILFRPETHNAYFLLPGAFGTLGWLAAFSSQVNKPQNESRLFDNRRTSFSLNLMPENYFLNKQNFVNQNIKPGRDLPLFHLGITFK